MTDHRFAGSWHRFALLIAFVAAAAPARAQAPRLYDRADLKALEHAFTKLAEDIRPSVVSIRTYELIDIGQGRQNLVKSPLSKGSGFIIDADGAILTNHHVIEEAGAITVRLHNGLVYEAEVVQIDARVDLAVIKIEEQHLKVVKFADLDKVKVGQWAFACGNPFGLGSDDGRTSVTYGIVSAMGRQLTSRLVRTRREQENRYYGNLLETSAAINPGVSGGPLFNIDGEVLGVVTAIETSSGVNEGHGYAVPVDKYIRRVVDTLKKGEAVRYGFLGVQVGDIGDGTLPTFVRGRPTKGAVIEEMLISGGPADKAGLQPRDVVVEFDGEAIEDSDHLVRLVGFTPVGHEAEIVFIRKSVKHTTKVTVADRGAVLGIGAEEKKVEPVKEEKPAEGEKEKAEVY